MGTTDLSERFLPLFLLFFLLISCRSCSIIFEGMYFRVFFRRFVVDLCVSILTSTLFFFSVITTATVRIDSGNYNNTTYYNPDIIVLLQFCIYLRTHARHIFRSISSFYFGCDNNRRVSMMRKMTTNDKSLNTCKKVVMHRNNREERYFKSTVLYT
mmetsp:Transcript_64174/g.71697  ORF Transcript_64174/g.71697 Transcript_64174/m.71697 type:complete len:156 (+) Transcript_64174:270-737(+)